ncbi:tandem-95 repeat protein [Halobacillus yeomjeoni]|uniref:Ig-like domain-containing protein n=1 Tax=Halobacillus yeomjeoni TaxID=311194 RepID=UPI001CD787BB|nr:Ig-like domain-containing protein [Halobacillus yeomjeoni]MCA0982865.1 tandem-95 repeat protein [Halobacillus yeomjeoni]
MNKKKLSTITKVGLASSLVISPLGNSVSATNSPNTSSEWDSVTFIPYVKNNGELIYDPANEPGISPDEVDFVSGYSKGSGDKPSFYIASNGTDMFFRMRLMENPYDRKGGFLSSVWFVQIAENGEHKATVGINGKSPHEDYVYVSNPKGTTVNSIYKTDSSGSHVPGTRVVEAENGQFFLDFQVPISKITEVAPSISSDSNIQLFFGTSKAANLSVINKDYMGPDRGGSYEDSASVKLSPSLTMEIPTISITSSASFDSKTPVLSGTTTKAAEGSEVELTINEKKYITTVSNQSWSIPVTDPLTNGTHTATVKVVNELNNIATTKQAIQIGKTITIDGGETRTVSSFPTTVSGTFTNDTGGSKKIEFVVKDSNGDPVSKSFKGIQVNNKTQKWSEDISLSLPEGTYTIEAVEDVKKNDNLPKATQTIVIDNQIDVSITSPADNTTSDNPFPTVTGNTDPKAEVSVFIDDQFHRTVSADDAGNWSLTLGKALAPGDHTFKAEATDDIGNKKETSVYSYKVSSLDISIINGYKVQLNDNIPTIRGRSTAPDGSEVIVKVGNRNTLTTQVKNGRWSVDINNPLDDATYSIQASVTSGGLTDSYTQELTIDSSTFVNISSPSNQAVTENKRESISGTAEPFATIGLNFNNGEKVETVFADAGGNWTYTPSSDLSLGKQDVIVTASDVNGNVKRASTSFIINTPGNSVPVIEDYNESIFKGESKSGQVTATDSDNDPLTYSKGSEPSNGTIEVKEDGTYTYTPDSDYTGTDNFTIEVSDGKGGAATSTVTIEIKEPPNKVPTTEDYSDATFKNETISGKVEGADADGDPLTYTKETDPSNGTVTVKEDGTWSYTPNTDYVGTDVFKVQVSDGKSTVTSTVTIDVKEPPNKAPTTEDYSDATFKNETISGKVEGADADGDPLTYTKETDPSNGTVTVKEDGTWSYTPNTDYVGTDVFKVQVSDGKSTVTSTVTIDVKEPPNKAPTTEDYSDTTLKNETISGKVEGADVDGDPLTYSKETDPSNGTVTVKEDGTWSYTPNTDYVGTDVFKVQVSDGKADVTSTVTIEIKEPPNKAPTTVDYSTTTFKNEAASGKVEGTDDDNDRLTYKQGTKPSHGNVTVKEDGSWVYTPTIDYVGLDSFEVLVSDGEAVVISKVTIDVKEPPNELPSVKNYSETTIKNEAVSGKVKGTDADNDPLTYSKESSPSHGTVTVKEDGTWTYTPVDDYVGEDLFKVQVSDGKAEVTSTVTIDVKEPPNQMPTVENYQKTVERNQTLNGVIEGADPDGDPLEYSKGTSPQHGTLTVEKDGKWTYTPEKDYTGTDRFTISLSDGKGGTATSTVSVTVKEPANQMPTAINYYEETEQNKPVSGSVVGSDPDKDVLTYSVEKQPSHGTLDLKDNGEWTYTPEKDYIGQDSFMVNVSDGKGGHATSTISVYVKEPVNQLPVVSNYNEEMEKNTSINGNVEGTDPDGDSLKYKKGRLPEHGEVEVTEQGRWSYTPEQDYTGTDSFTVITEDGKGGTATSTISVIVKEPVNQLPSAENSNKETEQNKSVSGKIEAIDPDKDPLTFKMKQEASQGTVVLKEDGNWVYTPDKDYIGDDSFKVEISDGKGGAVTSTVSISILEPVNQLPVVDNYNVETEQGQSVNGKVEGTDPDGDSLLFEEGKLPVHGDLKANSDGSWSYTPDPSFVGQDSFSIKASDGKGGVATSTILINVKEPVNRLPEIKNYNETTEVNKAISGKVEGTDPDGDSLVYSEASSPNHGSVNVDRTGEWTYSPNDNFIGFDSFTIEVSDGKGGTATTTVDIHIKEPVNQLPVVGNYKVKAEHNQSVNGRVSGTDPDGDSLTYSKGSSPSHGTVEIHSDGNWSYSPSNNYVGEDHFEVLVSDGKGGTATSTVSINVEPPVNLLPTVDNYTVKTELNKAVSGKVVGKDADGDPLTYSIKTSPGHGTTEVTKDGSWTYQPSTDYKGIDQFSIEVNDGKGGVVTSSITVNVSEPANHAPTVENYNMTTRENNAVSGKVSGIDSDGDSLSYTNGSGPEHGKVSVNIDGSWTYTPLQGYTGMDSFTINVSDGKGGTSFSTISINVLEPINQLPTINNHNEKTEQNHSVSGKVEGKDSDGDALTYSAGESPSHGAAEVNDDGSWTYTPQEDFSGTDSFTIQVSDGRGGVATSTILINVLEPVNNLPTVSNYNEVIFQGGHISGRVEGKDVDGDPLTYRLGKGSSHGTEEVNADGSWAYTPDKDYIGEDRFTIEVSDGKGGVTTSEVSILIKEIINHLPVVDNYNVVTEQNQPLEGKVEGSDSDGDPLLYSKAKDPEHGVVKVDEGGSWTYTPLEGYSGPDSFSVRVDDGKGGAATSTILVNVKEPVNHIPEVGNYNVTTEMNQQVEGRVIGSDTDGDLLNYSEGKGPLQGTLVVQKDGNWKYTPDQGFIGTDSFTIIVSDGKGGTKTSTISLNVMKPVNQLPVVDNYNETTLKNQALNGKIESTDPDGDELTFKLEKNPQHGIVKLEEDGTWVYTPDRSYSGPDSFGVIISDGNGGTVTSTVLINVKEPENTLPTVGNYQEETIQDQAATGKVVGEDADGDKLSYALESDPSNGKVEMSEDGTWTYTPKEGFIGTDEFTVLVKDENGGTALSTITLQVSEPENKLPTVGNYQEETIQDQAATGKVVGEDADGDKLSYALESDPSNGKVEMSEDGTWTYTPKEGFIGTDEFTVLVKDENGGTALSTITLQVSEPENTLPTVGNYQEETIQDQTATGKVVGEDADGDKLSYALESDPSNGKVEMSEDGTWTYTPKEGFIGTDEFTVLVKDGNGGTALSTITLQVSEPENTLPTVGNYQEETIQDQTATGKVVGEDADGDKLSYALESEPSNGKVEMSQDGTWTYTPKEGFTGTDEFTVLVKDENGGTALSMITLQVSEPENTLPTVGNYQEETIQDQTATGKVVGEDADGDKLSYTLETEPSNGKVEVSEDGTWSYTPIVGFTGTDEFKIKVEDTRGGSTVSTIVLQVKEPENELPIVENYTVETKENQSLSGIVEARDPEGTDLIYKLGSDAENGEVELKDNGSWFYTPDSGFVGKDQFKIKVTDARGGSSISMINVDVTDLDTKIIIDGGAELKSADRTPLVSGTAEAPKFSQVSIEILNSDGKMVLKDYTSILNGTWSYMLEKELAPGSYEIVATLKSEADEKLNKSVQALEVEESNVSLKLTSSPKAIVGDGKTKAVLTAIIKDGNGNPVKGERVSFSSKAGTLVNSEATTNDEGVAVVELISPDLSGTIESQQKVISAKVSNPDKNLYGESQIVVQYVPASVSGVIIDSSSKQPIPGSLIEVREDFNGDGVIDFEATAVTDSEGAYSIAVPYDNWDYTLNVTASTTLDGKKVPVNYSLKAKVGEIKGVGENIKSEKTISGQVFFLNRETNLPEEMDNQGKDINIKPVVLNSGDDDLEIKVDRNGKYVITGGQKGKSYDVMLNVEVEGENGEKQLMVGKKIKVDIPEDGISEVQTTLIDPYGVVTDEETGLPIENTTMKLYWADTELNRNKGRTPHTLVNLPILDGFAPNDNRVPQITNSKGEYAWMVFPDGDYYIIAENEKYHTYDSRAEGRNVSAKPGEDSYIKDGVIHVGQDIVEYDFSMKALSDDEDVNHPPSFKDYQFTVKENTVLTEKVTAEDPDGDMLAYSLYKKPSHGSLTLKDKGTFTYVPKPGFSGLDEFILRVEDEHGEVSVSTVKVTVEGNSLPDAPGNEIFLETFSGKTISGNLKALNIIDPVTIELKQPENGTADVSLSEMNWEYQPEEGFVGEDEFKVLYYNQQGILHTIEVHVQVHENTVPIGSDDEDRQNTNQEREGNSEDHHKEDLDELPKTGSIFDRNLLLAIASLFGSLGILLRRFGRKKENE